MGQRREQIGQGVQDDTVRRPEGWLVSQGQGLAFCGPTGCLLTAWQNAWCSVRKQKWSSHPECLLSGGELLDAGQAAPFISDKKMGAAVKPAKPEPPWTPHTEGLRSLCLVDSWLVLLPNQTISSFLKINSYKVFLCVGQCSINSTNQVQFHSPLGFFNRQAAKVRKVSCF